MTREISIKEHMRKIQKKATEQRKEEKALAEKYRAIGPEMEEISRIAKGRGMSEAELLRVLLGKLNNGN